MSMVALSPGFADPVRDAQACFRALLEATARPGTLARLTCPAPPPPLPEAMAAAALTLIDADTPVWLDAVAASPSACAWLRFHCGCRIVAEPENAAFALVAGPAHLDTLARLPAGTDEYPDRGATAIIAVTGFGAGEALRLSGPGIAGHAVLAVDGLPEGFIAARAANHALFPRGIDHVLVVGAAAVSLPRSTRITAMEG
jgi:alpha-D-ribose 1-methylphosphonate 5-triphosphate synthase subunit PhnH